MYTIREFKENSADYQAIVELSNAEWPSELTTVAELKYDDSTHDPDYFAVRFVIEDENHEIVAVFEAWEDSWAYVEGKYRLDYRIHPRIAHEALEEEIYQFLVGYLAKCETKPKLLDLFVNEERPDQVKFWMDRGFELIMREHAAELNVTHFDPAPFVRAYDKVASHGIEIFTLPELQKRFPDWLERMYTLSNQIEFEIPAADELTPQPLEDFATDLRHPQFLKDAHFFALDGDEWVGMSTLWKTPRKRKLNVGITGVLNSHRRKGIATALKLKTIEFAKEYGATTIATENEENNPMYQLNVMLGFEAKSAWLELRKDLTQAPAIVRPMVRSEQGLAWRPAVQSNLILTPQ